MYSRTRKCWVAVANEKYPWIRWGDWCFCRIVSSILTCSGLGLGFGLGFGFGLGRTAACSACTTPASIASSHTPAEPPPARLSSRRTSSASEWCICAAVAASPARACASSSVGAAASAVAGSAVSTWLGLG